MRRSAPGCLRLVPAGACVSEVQDVEAQMGDVGGAARYLVAAAGRGTQLFTCAADCA